MSRKGYLTLFVIDKMITMDEFVNRFTKWLDDAKRSMDKEYHLVKSLKDLYQLEMLFCLGGSKRKISYVTVMPKISFFLLNCALHGHEIVSVTCGADHTIAFSESSMQVYSWGW
ncbi:Ultraviolet-B receptor UVR8 [Camellia lanceoleosa]|uniref:Ultraviolet-B receptor UVR8 n=1 Tax=Camellia lanceoleosa TaxID=1840588 RepID=A0ACC0IKE0_9ERIC|nr:Ultraviolet-B receptor UVR8 [Camellia lanceoleosa]